MKASKKQTSESVARPQNSGPESGLNSESNSGPKSRLSDGVAANEPRGMGETKDLFADWSPGPSADAPNTAQPPVSSPQPGFVSRPLESGLAIEAPTSAPDKSTTARQSVRPRRQQRTSRQTSTRQRRSGVVSIDHLAATRRLHWKLRRAPAHSPEEVKAGRLICRHLLAMLDETTTRQAADGFVGDAANQTHHLESQAMNAAP